LSALPQAYSAPRDEVIVGIAGDHIYGKIEWVSHTGQ